MAEKLVAEILIHANVDGVDQATRKLDDVKTALEQAGIVATQTEKAFAGPGRAVERLAAKYIEGYGAADKMTTALARLGGLLNENSSFASTAATIYRGLAKDLGVVANEAHLVEKGYGLMALQVAEVNKQLSIQQNVLDRTNVNKLISASTGTNEASGVDRTERFAGQYGARESAEVFQAAFDQDAAKAALALEQYEREQAEAVLKYEIRQRELGEKTGKKLAEQFQAGLNQGLRVGVPAATDGGAGFEALERHLAEQDRLSVRYEVEQREQAERTGKKLAAEFQQGLNQGLRIGTTSAIDAGGGYQVLERYLEDQERLTVRYEIEQRQQAEITGKKLAEEFQQGINAGLRVGMSAIDAGAGAGVLERYFEQQEKLALKYEIEQRELGERVGSAFAKAYQENLNKVFGIGSESDFAGKAEASARAMETALEAQDRSLAAIRDKLDPMAGAQARLNAQIEEYDTLVRRAGMGEDERARAVDMLEREYADLWATQEKVIEQQRRFNALLNVRSSGDMTGSAAKSAAAMEADFANLATQAQRLRDEIDPLGAAQRRFNAEMDEAGRVARYVGMTEQELAAIRAQATKKLEERIRVIEKAASEERKFSRESLDTWKSAAAALAGAEKEHRDLASAAQQLKDEMEPLAAVERKHAEELRRLDEMARRHLITQQQLTAAKGNANKNVATVRADLDGSAEKLKQQALNAAEADKAVGALAKQQQAYFTDLANAAQKVKDRLDPVAAAQREYTQEIARFNEMAKAGALSANELARAQTDAAQRMKAAVGAADGSADNRAAEAQKVTAALNAQQREYEQLATSARNLKAEIDPLAASQAKYAQEMQRNQAMMRAGLLNEKEFAQANALSQQHLTTRNLALKNATKETGLLTQATGLTGRSLLNMSYQLNDIVSGLAMGQSPFMIITQQGGQVLQIMGEGEGGVMGALRKMGSFLSGLPMIVKAGFGAIIGGAAVVVAALNFEGAERKLENMRDQMRLIDQPLGQRSLTQNQAKEQLEAIIETAQRTGVSLDAVYDAQQKVVSATAKGGSLSGPLVGGATSIMPADMSAVQTFIDNIKRSGGDASSLLKAFFADVQKGSLSMETLNRLWKESPRFAKAFTDALGGNSRVMDEMRRGIAATGKEMVHASNTATRQLATLEARVPTIGEAWTEMGNKAETAWTRVQAALGKTTKGSTGALTGMIESIGDAFTYLGENAEGTAMVMSGVATAALFALNPVAGIIAGIVLFGDKVNLSTKGVYTLRQALFDLPSAAGKVYESFIDQAAKIDDNASSWNVLAHAIGGAGEALQGLSDPKKMFEQDAKDIEKLGKAWEWLKTKSVEYYNYVHEIDPSATGKALGEGLKPAEQAWDGLIDYQRLYKEGTPDGKGTGEQIASGLAPGKTAWQELTEKAGQYSEQFKQLVASTGLWKSLEDGKTAWGQLMEKVGAYLETASSFPSHGEQLANSVTPAEGAWERLIGKVRTYLGLAAQASSAAPVAQDNMSARNKGEYGGKQPSAYPQPYSTTGVPSGPWPGGAQMTGEQFGPSSSEQAQPWSNGGIQTTEMFGPELLDTARDQLTTAEQQASVLDEGLIATQQATAATEAARRATEAIPKSVDGVVQETGRVGNMLGQRFADETGKSITVWRSGNDNVKGGVDKNTSSTAGGLQNVVGAINGLSGSLSSQLAQMAARAGAGGGGGGGGGAPANPNYVFRSYSGDQGDGTLEDAQRIARIDASPWTSGGNPSNLPTAMSNGNSITGMAAQSQSDVRAYQKDMEDGQQDGSWVPAGQSRVTGQTTTWRYALRGSGGMSSLYGSSISGSGGTRDLVNQGAAAFEKYKAAGAAEMAAVQADLGGMGGGGAVGDLSGLDGISELIKTLRGQQTDIMNRGYEKSPYADEAGQKNPDNFYKGEMKWQQDQDRIWNRLQDQIDHLTRISSTAQTLVQQGATLPGDIARALASALVSAGMTGEQIANAIARLSGSSGSLKPSILDNRGGAGSFSGGTIPGAGVPRQFDPGRVPGNFGPSIYNRTINRAA